jgi:hypothetical protein
MTKFTVAVALSAGLLSCTAGHAASITADPARGTIRLVGEMAPDDIDTFRRVAAPMPPGTIVVLNSPGGAFLAGIRIGDTIRQKRFTTYVANGTLCGSACAMAWLGGVTRYVSSTGSIGFHGVYNAETLQADSAANAVAGAYLARIGLSENAIVYVMYKPHDDAEWLTAKAATDLGIDMRVSTCGTVDCLPTSPPAVRTAALPAQTDFSTTRREREVEEEDRRWTERRTEKEVTDALVKYLALLSSAGFDPHRDALFLANAEMVYARDVLYYGKSFPKAEIIATKRAFIRRWPIRNYRIRTGTLVVHCTGLSCSATGIMDWSASSPTESIKDADTFQYTFEWGDIGPEIAGESHKLLPRQTSATQ